MRPHDHAAPADDEGRRRHYAAFYGLADLPDSPVVVLGNCQAESLRLVLDDPALPTVRVPPVHELTPEDLPHLTRVLSRAGAVVAQPVRADYRDLPVGTDQVRGRLRSGVPMVLVPSVRFAGLHPFQVAPRVPGITGDPPLVAYHDLRTLAAAAGLPLRSRLTRAAVRGVAEDSLAELRRRERAHDTLVVSDVFDHPRFALMRTVNHAGNPVWTLLGSRVLTALGVDAGPTDPGRELLDAVHAPREPWVAEAWDSPEDTREHWLVNGAVLDPEEIRAAHLQWYQRHPGFVPAALDRLGDLLRRWAP